MCNIISDNNDITPLHKHDKLGMERRIKEDVKHKKEGDKFKRETDIKIESDTLQTESDKAKTESVTLKIEGDLRLKRDEEKQGEGYTEGVLEREGQKERLFKRKGEDGRGRVIKKRQTPTSPLLGEKERSSSMSKLLDV